MDYAAVALAPVLAIVAVVLAVIVGPFLKNLDERRLIDAMRDIVDRDREARAAKDERDDAIQASTDELKDKADEALSDPNGPSPLDAVWDDGLWDDPPAKP